MLSVYCIVLFHIQIFVNFIFSYDFVLIFIAKALFISANFKSYLHLSNSRQNLECGHKARV